VLALATRAGLGAASPLSDAPPVLTIALGLALVELSGYGYHRLAHRVPFLFRLHAVHHSAETMDWLASFRQHPLEIVLMTLAQNLPLVVLGVPLTDHALVILLLRVNTVFVHSNLRVPEALALLVATPSFHHRHHDRDREAKNFASVFPFLDRLFGTHDDAPAEAFGLEGTSSPSLVALLFGLGATGSRVSRRPRPRR
jgi:sterol desaturase/sphingolipid hydroxylase (fatty acid hydroxylase superfamily)